MEEKKCPIREQKNENCDFMACKCENIESDLIIITHDKLYNILLKHGYKLGKKFSWLSPLSTFITFLVALLTATFKNIKISDTLCIPKGTLSTIFGIGAIISLGYTIYLAVQAIRYRKDSTIKSLIDKIKGDKTTKCVYKKCPYYAEKCSIDDKMIAFVKASMEKNRKENIETTKCIYIEEGCPFYAKKSPRNIKAIAFFKKLRASEEFRKKFNNFLNNELSPLS